MIFVGIDPGASGGLVALYSDGSVRFCRMQNTEEGVWNWMKTFARPHVMPVVAIIEKVSGYVGVGQPGSAMFNFGVSYGGLRMALVAAGIPFEAATPQEWQKFLGIPPRRKGGVREYGRESMVDAGESKSQWKNRLKAKAEQLFPRLVVTLDVADALLIAHYCKVKYERRSP